MQLKKGEGEVCERYGHSGTYPKLAAKAPEKRPAFGKEIVFQPSISRGGAFSFRFQGRVPV